MLEKTGVIGGLDLPEKAEQTREIGLETTITSLFNITIDAQFCINWSLVPHLIVTLVLLYVVIHHCLLISLAWLAKAHQRANAILRYSVSMDASLLSRAYLV